MPFVKRNAAGQIVAVSDEHGAGITEELSASDGELECFLEKFRPEPAPMDVTDEKFIRVLEDLVELLMEKGVILFTELPSAAQNKMMDRKRLRRNLSRKLDLVDDD